MDVIKPAGFWSRFAAGFIDFVLLTLVIGGLSLVFYGEFLPENGTPFDALSLVYSLLLPVVWFGYTVGKKAFGIRIVKLDGGNVGIGTMLMRILVAGLVYGLTIGIGLIVSVFMVALREDKRSLHDFIAKTYVTKELPIKKYT